MADRLDDVVKKSVKEVVAERYSGSLNGRSSSQRRHFRKDTNPSGIVGRASHRSGGGIGKSVGVPTRGRIWFHSLSLPTSVVAMAFSIAGAKMLQKMWEGPLASPWDVLGLRTTYSVWKVPQKYGPHGELLFLPRQEGAFRSHKGSRF